MAPTCEGKSVPKGTNLYHCFIMHVVHLNAFSSYNLIMISLGAAATQTDPNIMLIHMAELLRIAKIRSFYGMREERRLQII